ncbi:MAG: Verru_Chthon cassette protein B [Chthoniobacteraceae bacterium]
MKKSCNWLAAFSMVEIVVALGVASFTMVSMLGMLPIGLSNSRSSTAQTGAMNLITAIAADLKATASGAAATPRFAIVTNATSGQTYYFNEEGTVSTSLQSDSRYKASVQAVWMPSTSETVQRVTISWPAQASAPNLGGSADVVVSQSRN